MTDAITTTVTWGDLKSANDDDLDEYREAYEEIQALATEEYGEDAPDRPLPDDPKNVPDDLLDLWVYQQQMEQYETSAKSLQKQKHVLDTLADELGDAPFKIKMLTGAETMDIETELRMLAQQDDTPASAVQVRRNGLTVDAATVDAPEGVPHDDDGSPVPSDAPNALTLALWEQVEAFNNAGAVDFRPAGFGDESVSPSGASSATPTPAGEPSEPSAPTDE